jgi:translation initiation factor 2B subunit (eIF-2B alpha/beta/delta family)
MHPIEHLRYIARARGADPRDLVRETAYALESLHCGPAEMMVACRRILERHADCAPLWWLCSHLLCGNEDAADLIDADTTDRMLADAVDSDARVLTLAGGPTVAAGLGRRGDLTVFVTDSRHFGSATIQYLERRDVACEPVQPEAIAAAMSEVDLVVIEADAVSTSRAITRIGGRALAVVAQACGVPVWLVAPTGTGLADQVLSAIDSHLRAEGGATWDLDHEVCDLTVIQRVIAGGALAPFAPELISRR